MKASVGNVQTLRTLGQIQAEIRAMAGQLVVLSREVAKLAELIAGQAEPAKGPAKPPAKK